MTFAAMSHAEEKHIAISMGTLDTARATAIVLDITEKAEAQGYTVATRDAQRSHAQQVADIQALMTLRPDCLVVSAAKSIGLKSVLEEAASQGIPIILVDRFALDVDGEAILCQIGMDTAWATEACVEVLSAYVGDAHANILEIQGTPGASTTNALSTGFRNALCLRPNLQIAGVVYGNDRRETAKQAVQLFHVRNPGGFDAILCHGDEEGIGAVEAQLSTGTDVPVLAVGGQDDMRRALMAGKLWACVEITPLYGEAVMAALLAAEAGEAVEPLQLFTGTVYTAENAAEMRGY